MDAVLRERLTDLWTQSDKLKTAEATYLRLEAERKPMLGRLTLNAQGKSIAEREAQAYASDDWRDFMRGHVQAEVEYQHEKRKFSILEQAFYAAYSTLKVDASAIRKPGVA